MRDPLAHVALRVDDVAGADRSRIRPCVAVIALAQISRMPRSIRHAGAEHAGLDAGADADDRAVEIGRAELPHAPRSVASACTTWVSRSDHSWTSCASASTAEHLVPEPLQVLGERAAEAAEPDDEDRALVDGLLANDGSLLRVGGTAGGARAARAPRPP